MKKLTLLILIVTSLTLSSCAYLGLSAGHNTSFDIRPGMTHQEVIHVMKGKPFYNRFNEIGVEQWEYHHNYQVNGDYDVIVVCFRDGKVVSLDSFPYIYPKSPMVKVEQENK